MIAVIRISGQVGLRHGLKETLDRLRIRQKYSCVLLRDTPENNKILLKIRNCVAYGKIDESTLKELISKRAKSLDKSKKVDVTSIIADMDKKSFQDMGIKPFFRLHPPLKGIDSKKHFGTTPKAVLGNNGEKINELIRRML